MTRAVCVALLVFSLVGLACAAPPSLRSPSFLSRAPSPSLSSSSSPSFPSFSFPSPSRPSSFSFPSPSASSASFNVPSFLQRAAPAPSSSSFAPPSSPSLDLPSPSTSSSSSSGGDAASNAHPNLPDPQQALSTLSSMSQNLAPSFTTGLNMIQTALPAVVSQMAPSQQQLMNQPSTEDSAVDLPATSSTSSQPPVTNAASPSPSSSTPVRGQSPFPFVPTDFVNPLDNPSHRVPQPPAASCAQTEFQCQAYKQCYPCYDDTSLAQCGTCLNLMKCQDANCQLKQMCNLCKHASSMAVCPMAEPYCPL